MNELQSKLIDKFQAIMKFPRLMRLDASKLLLNMHYEDLQKVMESPEHHAAISIFIPPEILVAFDARYIPIEQFGAMIYQLLNSDKEIADAPAEMKAHYLEHPMVCSISSGILAALHHEILPLPEYFLVCSHQCDDSLKCIEMLAKNYKKEVFVLDVPFYKNESSFHYLENQLRDLATFVARKTNKSLDVANLQQAIELSNTANNYRKKVLELMRYQPQMLKMAELVQIYPLYTKFGRPATVEIYKTLYEELLHFLEQKKYPYSGQQYRILWLGSVPITNPAFLRYVETELKLSIVNAELMSHADFVQMDPEKPFQSLARKIMSAPTVGSVQNRIQWIEKAINEYQIDGIVHFSQIACRDFEGGVKFIHDLCVRIGLPMVEINADAGNKLNFPIESIKTRLEAFVELLENRRMDDERKSG